MILGVEPSPRKTSFAVKSIVEVWLIFVECLSRPAIIFVGPATAEKPGKALVYCVVNVEGLKADSNEDATSGVGDAANSPSKLTTSLCATAANDLASSERKSLSNAVAISVLISAIILDAAVIAAE